MIPRLALELGTTAHAWRLDNEAHAASWNSGIGAFIHGGRWSPVGSHAVYCSLDPSTAILEVAARKGFEYLDTHPMVLTVFEIIDSTDVDVIIDSRIPNPVWLQPGGASRGQQNFGREAMLKKPFIAAPSVVSKHSWNLVFDPAVAVKKYRKVHQEKFGLDTRLNPPAAA